MPPHWLIHTFAAAALLGLFSQPAHAEVYTYIDAEGNRVFTDQPPKGNAERIELAPSNSFGNSVQPPQPVVEYQQQPPPPTYELLRILMPEPDVTISDNDGNLLVTLNSEPPLRPADNFRLLLDGQPYGAPTRSAVFELKNIDRGTHQLAAEIIDPYGRILERTPSQPFHMKRTSLALKRLANPCEKGDWGVRPECPLADKPKEPKKDIPLVPFI